MYGLEIMSSDLNKLLKLYNLIVEKQINGTK